MIRIARYSTSAAAVLLFLSAGMWWMFFGQGVRNAWADAIDQVAQVQSATCNLHVHRGGFEEIFKTYLEGSRVRVEDPNRFYVVDFPEGKSLWVEKSTKTAVISELNEDHSGLMVLGSNPLNDLMQMKSAPAERLPDEYVRDMSCQVYRVTETAFMGYKVPWVKLWLDPDSKLPVQIHSVVADRQAMTLTEFRWNEPFDEELMELAVPEGHELAESSDSKEASKAADRPLSDSVATNEVRSTKDGDSTEAGREIPVGQIAKTLDMLGQRMEANYKAIDSWSGTFDVTERYRYTNPNNPQYEQISHSAVEFFAEPGRDRIRLNNRAVDRVRIISSANITPASERPESRWVRTPEQLLRFPVSELQHTVKGFSRIAGLNTGKGFRVLHREPPMAAEQYGAQGYINPLSFFGHGQTNWEMCFMLAGVLRGESGPDDLEYAKRSITLRVRENGSGSEYVLTQRFKPIGSGQIFEWVFPSEAGFNVVSREFRMNGQIQAVQQFKFRNENGAFIPCEIEYKRYEDQSTKDPERLPTQHHVFILEQTRVNAPIDPAVFEIQTLGLREGDRMVDRIENRMEVFDGKQFVSVDKFKRLPAAEVRRDDSQRAQSTNNMKQLALCMQTYHDTHKTFPARAVFDKDGKPLLSWRVHILPDLGRGDLYNQFHLDEPWDSPNNKKLIDQMPAVFRSVASKAPANTTTYLVPVGPDTLFEGNKGRSIREIADGTSNTIMLLEVNGDQAVIWTEPDDFEYDQETPMRNLVGPSPDGFLAAFADGSVEFIWSSIEPTVLKAFFTPDGGEKVGREALGQ